MSYTQILIPCGVTLTNDSAGFLYFGSESERSLTLENSGMWEPAVATGLPALFEEAGAGND